MCRPLQWKVASRAAPATSATMTLTTPSAGARDLIASLDCRTNADHRLADLNRVAACDLRP
jgi:hypothetical protein